MNGTGPSAWSDAALAATLFAIDPVGTGGIVVRSAPGPVRERWLKRLKSLLPERPVRSVPLGVADGRLLGGLDLTATLAAGRPVAERGLLASADGGVVLLAMAERLAPLTASRLAGALDSGEVAVERDGLSFRGPARFGVVALDEGIDEEERTPAVLAERLAFAVALDTVAVGEAEEFGTDQSAVAEARARLPGIEATSEITAALCETAALLGIASLRAPLLALKVAAAAAALAGVARIGPEEAALAARLVLAHRATRWPEAGDPAPPPEAPPAPEPGEAGESSPSDRAPGEVVLAAALAAIPPGLLARLKAAEAARGRSPGRAGAARLGALRGRPAGTRRGEPRGGARLALVETLRAAAPWQGLRRREDGPRRTGVPKVEVRPDDLRLARFEERTRTTTIFVVDASGSAAYQRLAEAKGAVELLLADCYVRRDQVALIAFRGAGAELLLPPTRSLVRAKRALAALPGGGGTPLAAGLDLAANLAEAVRRRGETPSLVVLTDGRANIARDGAPGRAKAEAEARAAAGRARRSGAPALLVDTAPRPRPEAADLAGALGAAYLPLPHADARALSAAIRAGTGRSAGSRR